MAELLLGAERAESSGLASALSSQLYSLCISPNPSPFLTLRGLFRE